MFSPYNEYLAQSRVQELYDHEIQTVERQNLAHAVTEELRGMQQAPVRQLAQRLAASFGRLHPVRRSGTSAF